MPRFGWKGEEDARAPRLESEVRQSEAMASDFAGKRKFLCSNCHTMYEEKSKHCPKRECQIKGKTMGELKPIPDQHLEQAQRGSISRARQHRGARLPGQGI